MSETGGERIGAERGPLLLVAGARVDGKYELVECLGEGGMGTVWCARHVSLGHAVAIKFLQTATQGSDARARFEREARIAARLGEASRHIARVIDHGVLPEGVPYLVMELLHGETLSARLKRRGRVSLASAARLSAQLCRALQAAHLAGVVHRDVKPANVFLCAGETDDDVLLKLMDFGVAKAARESEDEPTTRAGMAIGTPSYMSPEQILCKTVDARSDLWGVAAVVYRMVTARSPFGNGGMAELGLRILATDPPPPSSIVPELPRSFDAWIAKALAKNPEERFQSARDLADALALIAGIPRGAEPAPISLGSEPACLTPTLDAPPSVSLAFDYDPGRPTRPEGVRPRRRASWRRRVAIAIPLAALLPLALLPLLRGTGLHAEPSAVAAGQQPFAPTVSPEASVSDPSTRSASVPSSASAASASIAAASSSPTSPVLPSASGAQGASSPSIAARPVATASAGAPGATPLPASPRPTASALRAQADAAWRKRDEL
jgi:serine/threonine-protein kinase